MNVEYCWGVTWNEMGKGGLHAPDQDYAQEDSYHTCLQHHRGLCLFGQHCTHKGSYPFHSVCLENNGQDSIQYKYIIYTIIQSSKMQNRDRGVHHTQ